jgi:hypothetical protein
MAQPKCIFLTGVSTIANEKGLKKIEDLKNGDSEEGLPKSWYTDQGLKPPKGAREEGIDEDGFVELEEDEVEHVHTDIILERSDFSSAEDGVNEELTTVITKSAVIYKVLEDTNYIFEQLYILDQNIFEKWYDEIKWRVKRLFNKEKDLILELKQE